MQMLIKIGDSHFNVMSISRLDDVQEVKVTRPRPGEGSFTTDQRTKLVYNFNFRSDGYGYKSPDFKMKEEAQQLWIQIYDAFEQIGAVYTPLQAIEGTWVPGEVGETDHGN